MTDLYRFFDANDRLLYVGISLSAVQRASEHRRDKGWWSDVDRMTIERISDDRKEALEVERKAILAERPIYNVIHNSNGAALPTSTTLDAASDTVGLVGLFLHTFDDEGVLRQQGQIQAELEQNVYLVQWFSFLDGCPCESTIHELSEMRSWKFHSSQEDWHDWYSRYSKRKADERREVHSSLIAGIVGTAPSDPNDDNLEAWGRELSARAKSEIEKAQCREAWRIVINKYNATRSVSA